MPRTFEESPSTTTGNAGQLVECFVYTVHLLFHPLSPPGGPHLGPQKSSPKPQHRTKTKTSTLKTTQTLNPTPQSNIFNQRPATEQSSSSSSSQPQPQLQQQLQQPSATLNQTQRQLLRASTSMAPETFRKLVLKTWDTPDPATGRLRTADYWLKLTNHWVRFHYVARIPLFVPREPLRGPATGDLGPDRMTMMLALDDGLETIRPCRDSWLTDTWSYADATAERDMSNYWKGATLFSFPALVCGPRFLHPK